MAAGLGLASSLFFAATFVLNRGMNLAGGSWVWSGVLRFAFMLPLLGALLLPRGRLRPVLADIARRPGPWLLWSTVGFGFFYAPLCLASTLGPAWILAATWQVTIVAGIILTPLFGKRIPLRALAFSALILAGVALIQVREAASASGGASLAGAGLVLVAAFAYPLGNRKMMALCGDTLGTIQRVFGMTLCSLPFWALLAVYGLAVDGPPSAIQAAQSLLVALSSGVVATLLFFKATELAKGDAHGLAAAESTQAGEVVFSLLGGTLLFGDPLPDALGAVGVAAVAIGMGLNAHSSTTSSG